MSKKIRLGILGGGGDSLVGILHRIATAMHNKYEIVGGVFNPNFDENLKFAKKIGLNENRIYEDFEKSQIPIFNEKAVCSLGNSLELTGKLDPLGVQYSISVLERFKNILKGKKIRNDIIEAVDSSHAGIDFLLLYKKCLIINKNISKDICKNIIGTYKRASNIIEQELKGKKGEVLGQPESFLFKKDEEKHEEKEEEKEEDKKEN